eukprot:s3436_g8.t1
MWRGYPEGDAAKMAEAYIASLWDKGSQRHQWAEQPPEPHGKPQKDSREKTSSRPRLLSRDSCGYHQYVPDRGERRRRRSSHDGSRRHRGRSSHDGSRRHRGSRGASDQGHGRSRRAQSARGDRGRTRSHSRREQKEPRKEDTAKRPRRTESAERRDASEEKQEDVKEEEDCQLAADKAQPAEPALKKSVPAQAPAPKIPGKPAAKAKAKAGSSAGQATPLRSQEAAKVAAAVDTAAPLPTGQEAPKGCSLCGWLLPWQPARKLPRLRPLGIRLLTCQPASKPRPLSCF